MTAIHRNEARRRRLSARRDSRVRAGRRTAAVQREATQHRPPWTLAEMRRRWPDWHEDVLRERQRRVERGQPPHIEDVGVLTAIAEVLRMWEEEKRERAEREESERRRRKS